MRTVNNPSLTPQISRESLPASFLEPSLIGAVTLAAVVDIPSLPVRLQQGFAQRPWPTHELHQQIVERKYLPVMPTISSPESWTLEIVEDYRVRINGAEKTELVRGLRLELFNLLLLTRDWYLRLSDYRALGFARLRTTSHVDSVFQGSLKRLQSIASPHPIVLNTNCPDEGAYVYALHPAVRVVDRREFQ